MGLLGVGSKPKIVRVLVNSIRIRNPGFLEGSGSELRKLSQFPKKCISFVWRHHDLYIRWLLISVSAHMEYIRHFDLLKAFGNIERTIKSEKDVGKDVGKDLFYIIRAQHVPSYHLTCMSTMGGT